MGIVLGLATMAAAYVTLISSGTGTAHAAAIGPPTGFTATSSLPNEATLSWTAPSNPSPTGYTLTQSPGTLAGTCTTLTGSSVSCMATGLTPGTQYTWHLTASYDSWSSSTTAATVTTGSPSIALIPVSGSGGTLVTMTGSGFAPSSHLAFTFASSGSSPSALDPSNCTPTTTATGLLPAGPCEVTIPTASSLGAGTITVTDAAGNAATAGFTVTAGAGLGALSVAPTSVVNASTGNTLTFAYTAPGGALTNGAVDISVASWVAAGGTAPQTGNPAGAGYTVASTGSVTYTGTNELIEVTEVVLPANGTLTVTYGSGGGASGVTAPASSGTSVPYTFTVSEASSASQSPGALGTSPQVTVTAGTGPVAVASGSAIGGTTSLGVQPAPQGGTSTAPTSSPTGTANRSGGGASSTGGSAGGAGGGGAGGGVGTNTTGSPAGQNASGGSSAGGTSSPGGPTSTVVSP